MKSRAIPIVDADQNLTHKGGFAAMSNRPGPRVAKGSVEVASMPECFCLLARIEWDGFNVLQALGR